MSDLSSAERKRQRDRRAQQNLRDKKLRYQTNLEEKVAHCEQFHNEQAVQRLLEVITGLRKQNENYASRQEALKSLVGSWEEEPRQEPGKANLWLSQNSISSPENTCTLETLASMMANGSAPARNTAPVTTPETPVHVMTCQSVPSDRPLWNRIPLYTDDFSDMKKVSVPWFAFPEQIAACPDSPSPLDILYGSKTNSLANMIHLALERRPIRDPERLAMGWSVYHFSRWAASPSPESYARVPPYLRPTEEQLTIPHPFALGGVPWPKIRSNMIHQWHLHDMDRDSLFGMLACCVKIRWPWGVKILERTDDNELRMKPAFYEIFMKEDGWGITPEFMERFPELMTGVDVDSIIFKIS